MKKIFILAALFSFTIFTSCNKEEMEDSFVAADEELATQNADRHNDKSMIVAQAAFTINNEDNTLWESDELLLTNNSVNAVTYHWDFGNGDTSTEANPTYNKYKMHGPFSVTLTVTDALGHAHQTSQDIVVLCIFGGALHQF